MYILIIVSPDIARSQDWVSLCIPSHRSEHGVNQTDDTKKGNLIGAGKLDQYEGQGKNGSVCILKPKYIVHTVCKSGRKCLAADASAKSRRRNLH